MAFFQRLVGRDVARIDSLAYKSDYFEQRNHVLVDVRTPQEFKSGHIPGAKNIPLQTIQKELTKITKDQPVVFVCQSGSRSATACRILQEAGYENCINLIGGMIHWRMGGNPIK